MSWVAVQRYASVQARKRTAGIALWLVEDDVISRVGVTTAPNYMVSSYLELFGATEIIVRAHRSTSRTSGEITVPSGVTIRYVPAAPSYTIPRVPRRMYEGRLSPLIHAAFKEGFYALHTVGPHKIGSRLLIEEATMEWIKEHGAKRPYT